MRKLRAQLIEQVWRKRRDQVAENGLIAQRVVFESGRQIESVVQRGDVRIPGVVEEVTAGQRVTLGKTVIELDQEVVGVRVPKNIEVLGGNP